MKQLIWENVNYSEIKEYLVKREIKKVLLVCGKSFYGMRISREVDAIEKETGIVFEKFSDFKPNPDYSSTELGVRVFREHQCEAIIAVGGGSAIDVAKCIKMFSNLNPAENYLKQNIVGCDIPFIAIPTTAGTGSESTPFAVIYYQGEKQSVLHACCLPDAVFFDPSTLMHLPEYHKKSALLDALCHGIESYWSVNSTKESRRVAMESIQLILENYERYIRGEVKVNLTMLKAANLAGQAIGITKTTAAHAMSYKLTSLYGMAHGHAAMACLMQLWKYMKYHTEDCVDSRGRKYVEDIFAQLEDVMIQAENIWKDWKLPVNINEKDLDILSQSVNQDRLGNHPIYLSEITLRNIYANMH